MHYYEVAPNQIIRTNSASFTYASEVNLTVGQVVVIEVGKKSLVGVVVRPVQKPSYETKLVSSVLADTKLPHALVDLALWMAEYYGTHLALVIQMLLPKGLTKKRRERQSDSILSVRKRTNIVLTPEQSTAIASVSSLREGSALLHGITGSGKTVVYIELAKQALASGKSVIILVPEIALTSQLVSEFSHHFDDIILTHSKQTEAERHKAWLDASQSKTPRIAIGPRSALFMPLRTVGLIVIDEAHEPSFKQEQSPRYSALRAASILAQRHHAKLLFGSATPSIAEYYIAAEAKRPIITMTHSARPDTVKPAVSLVDMTKRSNFKQHRFLSDKLLTQLQQAFENGNQALIFHNRRGTTSTTLCTECGWTALDPETFLPLTLHADQHVLRSHLTGSTWPVPTQCPECGSTDIIHKGIGTKLIESELRKLFPDKTIGRFDGDSTAAETLEQKYNQLYDGTIDIIIGTQVIAKGLDLPKLRTVGVVQADNGLALPDFAASERTFQLLAQVIGRVGRSHHETSVVVQSYQPDHPAITYGLAQDYKQFYDLEIKERKRALFPPFRFLLKLTCVYKTETAAIRNAKLLAEQLRSTAPHTVEILGPTPAFYERIHDSYRWQLILKSSKRQDLVAIIPQIPQSHWQFELDPHSLL